jgi:hypothetical protein
MKKVTFFAIMTAATALLITPSLAQDSTMSHSTRHMRHHASHHMSHHARAHRNMNVAYRDNWNGRDGNWPGAVAAGVVGGAVGTAAAVATAPFGGPGAYHDSYAYGGTGYAGGPGYADSYSYDGTALPYSSNYAARNGFVCRPGTVDRSTGLICQ